MDGRLFPPQNKQMIFYLTVLFLLFTIPSLYLTITPKKELKDSLR